MTDDITVRKHFGPRAPLRPLFGLAEDSAVALDAYIDAGRVLVAEDAGEVVGHLQLTETGRPDELEVKTWPCRRTFSVAGSGAP